VAVIAAYVLVEKVGPSGHRLSQAMGTLSILWGVALLVGAFL
jgi:hypothetical protein